MNSKVAQAVFCYINTPSFKSFSTDNETDRHTDKLRERQPKTLLTPRDTRDIANKCIGLSAAIGVQNKQIDDTLKTSGRCAAAAINFNRSLNLNANTYPIPNRNSNPTNQFLPRDAMHPRY